MSKLPPRGSRRLAPFMLFASLAALAPRPAAASPEVVALRGVPSSVSARYGAAVALGATFPGKYLIPSTTGFEIRLASQASADSLLASFRSAGTFTEAVAAGSTFYLMAGTTGIVAADVSDPSVPAAIGSYGGIGTVEHGAYAAGVGVLAAAGGSTVCFLKEGAPGELSLLERFAYSDGRRVVRLAARGDSVLAAWSRAGSRLILTLYRASSGAAPQTLWEIQANGHDVVDLTWQGRTAFLAETSVASGGPGILPFDLPSQALRPITPLSGGRVPVSLDADATSLVAAGENRLFAAFARAGSLGDSLIGESDALLSLEPAKVGLVSGHAILSTNNQAAPSEPDEVARSGIEDRDLLLSVTAPPVGATGRARRVAQAGGYAYLADYTGGLRIYRAGGSDSSLVGVLPGQPNGRTYDLALDPTLHLVYLASGAAGVEVVDVTDPSAPQRIGSLLPPGQARCVLQPGPSLLAVGWNSGPGTGGVQFLDVSTPAAPVARGGVSIGPSGSIADPRSLAVKDTVLYVADALSGVFSVAFGNPDAPRILGVPSGVVGTIDVDVQGNTLLAATRLRGVQVVDVSQPAAAILRAEVDLPPVFGVTQQGSQAVALLGPEGAVVIDLSDPSRPAIRGPIPVPGTARAGTWVGDTLLVAASYGLERYQVSPSPVAVAALAVTYDRASARPRTLVRWMLAAPPGAVGLDLYRDRTDSGGSAVATGVRVNGALLPPAPGSLSDTGVEPGGTYRYRLEAFFPDGSSLKVAEGTVFIPSNSRLGRPYPNPFLPKSGAALSIPFLTEPANPGSVARVRVFDMRGRLVRSVSVPVAAGGGFGATTWDGKDERGVPVASGHYFIHVRGPGIDEAKSVVLVR